MTEPQLVVWTMVTLCGIGGAVAWIACMYANRLDRLENKKPDADVAAILTTPAGVFGFVVIASLLGSAVLHADEYIDTCSLIDPNESWAAYVIWLAAGCFW